MPFIYVSTCCRFRYPAPVLPVGPVIAAEVAGTDDVGAAVPVLPVVPVPAPVLPVGPLARLALLEQPASRRTAKIRSTHLCMPVDLHIMAVSRGVLIEIAEADAEVK